MKKVRQATGCTVTAEQLEKNGKKHTITEYGAIAGGCPEENTKSINRAVQAAAEAGGGTVVVPSGEYETYTIRLVSNVNLFFEKGAVIRAAKCGDGLGNYDEPEIRRYVGLQDHGHTYFANSLVYGENLENVMIYGSGLFDGSYRDEEGFTGYALSGGDPPENEYRNRPGHQGTWFGNKGIALVNCKNVVLKNFSVVDGGHFAIICEGVENLLVDSVLVDTIRDALDIDCCRNVTVVRSWFNSLTDDALVMKASYGAGNYMPLYNVYIEDCDVTGFDAGSVYGKKFTCDKLIAADRCGPTARVKLGTESTCGYELVTVKKVRFRRSRGFALEAVDTSDLKDIVFTDCTMDNVSSSPIFIYIGDRARFPVTGTSHEELVRAKDNVRLDNAQWVLPDTPNYRCYPAKRYTPSYNYSKKVTVDGRSFFNIVDEDNPVKLNPVNYHEKDGRYYEYRYDEETRSYEPDFSKEIPENRLCLYANAVGNERIASVKNVEISNVTVRSADPRYPIIIMGADSSHIENITLKNIDVEYRGGLKPEHAVEQRQLNTNWEYSQFGAKPSVQVLPWLVNTFFVKNEGLLPRMSWNKENEGFVPSPYNVPELAAAYPEPSKWGILPAYGLYARHVDGLCLSGVRLRYIAKEERPAAVFDDVHDALVEECHFQAEDAAAQIVLVKNNYKRPTNLEYVPDYPYHATDNSVRLIPERGGTDYRVEHACVDAPAPGTPRDSLYPYPTAAVRENGYAYEVETDNYPLPATVHRPYFVPVGDIWAAAGEEVRFDVQVQNPLIGSAKAESDGTVWNEKNAKKEYTVDGESGILILQAKNLPQGAEFDASAGIFCWVPQKAGKYDAVFTADDGVCPVQMTVHIRVDE